MCGSYFVRPCIPSASVVCLGVQCTFFCLVMCISVVLLYSPVVGDVCHELSCSFLVLGLCKVSFCTHLLFLVGCNVSLGMCNVSSFAHLWAGLCDNALQWSPCTVVPPCTTASPWSCALSVGGWSRLISSNSIAVLGFLLPVSSSLCLLDVLVGVT